MLIEKYKKRIRKSKVLLFFLFSIFIIIVSNISSRELINSQDFNNNNSERIIKNSATPIQTEYLTYYYNGSGWAFDVFILDDIAYIADYGDGLEIVNISDPSNPVTLGGCIPSGLGEALGVFISGDLAYLAYGKGGLRIINISDPVHPIEIGVGYDDDSNPSGANAVYVEGNIAYLADTDDGLELIDVSNPYLPIEISQYGDSYNNTKDVFISGTFAYVADGNDGLEIIDISDPLNPARIGQYYDDYNNTRSVIISNNRAYITDYWDGLEIIDISIPSNPKKLGYYYNPEYGFTEDVFIFGNTAYLLCRYNGLEILDISDPSDITQLGEYYILDEMLSLFYSQGITYVTGVSVGLSIINVNLIEGRWSIPSQLGLYSNEDGGENEDLFVWNNYTYIADGLGGLEIINITDRTNPVKVGQFYDGGQAMDVFVSNNIAYVADYENGLEIINVTDPLNTTGSFIKIGNYSDGGDAKGVYISGNLAYVTDSSYLEILNITDPTNPVEIGQCFVNGAYDVEISGNFAFVTRWLDGLSIIDIRDPTNPQEVSVINNGGTASKLKILGYFVYVTDINTGLEIYNIKNPYKPIVEVNQFQEGKPGGSYGISLFGNYAFLADGSDGVEVLNITNPANILKIFSTYYMGSNVYIDNNYIYLLGDGLIIFDNGYLNPWRTDNDTDGLLDSYELFTLGTDPDDSDSDDDGLSDGEEVIIFGTDPNVWDHDVDGMPDGWEVYNGLNATNPDANDDYDGDGIDNIDEYNSIYTIYANNSDSDGDLMPDGWEVQYNLIPDTDDAFLDQDTDSLDNIDEYLNGCDPYDEDCDDDGFSDGAEIRAGTDPLNPNSFPNPSDPFPWWFQAILAGTISALVGISIKTSYSRFKRSQELRGKILKKLNKIDDIELFLKEKLGYKEWIKLKEPLEQYKNREINNKTLIKIGKKEIGDKFTDVFIDK